MKDSVRLTEIETQKLKFRARIGIIFDIPVPEVPYLAVGKRDTIRQMQVLQPK